MDADIQIVIGTLLAILSLPSILTAFTDGRAPKIGVAVFLLACGLLIHAWTITPGGYTPAEVPLAFYRLIGAWRH